MAGIFYIVKEEQKRLFEAQQAYEAAISREVQGSPQVKHIGRKNYLYLAQRRGRKVTYTYIGKVDDEKARKVMDSINKRKEYQALLRNVLRDLNEVKKALRGQKI